jgi:hypothetical protein
MRNFPAPLQQVGPLRRHRNIAVPQAILKEPHLRPLAIAGRCFKVKVIFAHVQRDFFGAVPQSGPKRTGCPEQGWLPKRLEAQRDLLPGKTSVGKDM